MNDRIEPKLIKESSPPKTSSSHGSDSSKFEEQLELSKKKLGDISLSTWNQIQGIFLNPNTFQLQPNSSFLKSDFHSHEIKEIKKSLNPNFTYNLNQTPLKTEAKEQTQTSAMVKKMAQDLLLNQTGNPMQIIFPFQNLLAELGSKFADKSLSLDLLIEEISGKVKLLKEGGKTELEMNLIPKELGKMVLNISKENGIISIIITASPAAKDILDGHLAELLESLKNSELNIGNLQVEVGKDSQQKYSSDESIKFFSFGETEENHFTPFIDSYILSRKLGWFPQLTIYTQT